MCMCTTAPSESTLPFSRRSELISKIYATAGLMGNDHILSLRTGDGLVQRRAPALGRRICVPGSRRASRIGAGCYGTSGTVPLRYRNAVIVLYSTV